MASFIDFRLKHIKYVHDSAWGILAAGTKEYTNGYSFFLVNSALDAGLIEMDDMLCPELPIYGFMTTYYLYSRLKYQKSLRELSPDEDTLLSFVDRIISNFPNYKASHQFREIIFNCYNAKEPEYGPNDNDTEKLLKKLENFCFFFSKYIENIIGKNNPNRNFIASLEEYFKRSGQKGNIVYGADLLDFCLTYLGKDYESPEKPKIENASDFVEFSQSFTNLQKDILKKVISQDNAVRKFVKGLYDGTIRDMNNLNGPESCFLFVGPPGVGKTYLAQTAADLSGRPHKVFYMSEYAHESSFNGLGRR